MDTVTPARRSEIMAAIRSKDTAPELAVRRYLHASGLRYRLHRHRLPGRPDLIFPGRRLCLFVHGCFWHGCPHCRHGAREVKSNTSYWSVKLARNKARDAENQN
jgi:DNA mismatch endonuclease, patch repair protein